MIGGLVVVGLCEFNWLVELTERICFGALVNYVGRHMICRISKDKIGYVSVQL